MRALHFVGPGLRIGKSNKTNLEIINDFCSFFFVKYRLCFYAYILNAIMCVKTLKFKFQVRVFTNLEKQQRRQLHLTGTRGLSSKSRWNLRIGTCPVLTNPMHFFENLNCYLERILSRCGQLK